MREIKNIIIKIERFQSKKLKFFKENLMGNKKNSVIERFAKKGVFPYQFAFTLLIPIRNIFLSPQKLIERLELKEGDNVLEVGAGPGYFSLKVAKLLKNGKITLADIQQEMLDIAKKRLAKRKVENANYYLCNGTKFEIEDNKFDVVYMVTVLGEIENQKEYIGEFYRMLKPNGVLSISEQGGDPDKMSVEEIKELLKNFNFEFYKLYGTKNNFTINFKKK